MAEVSESELRSMVKELIADVDANDRVAFRGAQYDRGLAWVSFPEGYRAHQIRLDGGDCSTDSFCYPSV